MLGLEAGIATHIGNAIPPRTMRTGSRVVVSGHPGSQTARLRGMLRNESYQVLETRSWLELFDVLKGGGADLVIFDASTSFSSTLQSCRRIKFDPRTELVPVMVLTEGENVSDSIAAIDSGADEVLGAPYHHCSRRITTELQPGLWNSGKVPGPKPRCAILRWEHPQEVDCPPGFAGKDHPDNWYAATEGLKPTLSF